MWCHDLNRDPVIRRWHYMEFIHDLNRDPVIHRWHYQLDTAS
jgi:hypothetical protein